VKALYEKDSITIYCGQSEEIRRELPNGSFGTLLMDGPGDFHAQTAIDWLPWVRTWGSVIVMRRDSWALFGQFGLPKVPDWKPMPELAPKVEFGHYAARPVEAIKMLLQATEGPILDPYMGVGSTLIAAKKLGRQAVGIERDERWCQTAITRLETA
jgi:hypothetical protein